MGRMESAERTSARTAATTLTASLLVTLLTGCTGDSGTLASEDSAAEPPADATTSTNATTIDNTEPAMVKAARSQLEARLGADAGAITTEAFARVVWPNGAIGCPKPGRSYTMALVPGYQVILRADDRLYHYHGREGQAPFYCARPQGQGGWEMDR